MLTISQLAKKSGVTARAIRLYESLGILTPSVRGANDYRYFKRAHLERVREIRHLQTLGFTLTEVAQILQVSRSDLEVRLKKKAQETDAELKSLTERRARLKKLLSVSRSSSARESLSQTERTLYMDAIRTEILNGLTARSGGVSSNQARYLTRENPLLAREDQKKLLVAIRECLQFARKNQLRLGPGRGNSSASLALFGLGWNEVDPSRHDLIPERLIDHVTEVHMDVEFERGQMFVDFCQEISRELGPKKIQAFKLPLLDILNRTHERLSKPLKLEQIEDDSETVLAPFRRGEVEKIFCIDQSAQTLIMKLEPYWAEYLGSEKIGAYFKSLKHLSFRDVLNVSALWRPRAPELMDRVERYRKAQLEPVVDPDLKPELQRSLEPNYGLVIYHEDLIRIIQGHTGLSLEASNSIRRGLFRQDPDALRLWGEQRGKMPETVWTLVRDEAPWTFCQPHTLAFGRLTKETAVLRNLHSKIYFEEIARFEQKSGLAWDDFGVRIPGVTLLQS